MGGPTVKPRALLGVLGGMGPAATADFLAKLVKATPARRDQQHIPTITCSIPQIPDRTEAILHGGPSPLPAMLHGLALLEASGASCIAIPCNTAHFWFDELQQRTALPIVHVVDAAVEMIRARDKRTGVVGLLATTATVEAGVYANRLRTHGIQCMVPDSHDQSRVMDVVRAVKSIGPSENGAREISEIASRLAERGAASIILGCSELPLVASQETERYIDATEALAIACVRAFHASRGLDNTLRKSKVRL